MFSQWWLRKLCTFFLSRPIWLIWLGIKVIGPGFPATSLLICVILLLLLLFFNNIFYRSPSRMRQTQSVILLFCVELA